MNKALDAIIQILVSIAFWVSVALPAILMPRRPDRVTVIGRDEGKFVDNAKYAFLSADQDRFEVALVSAKKETVKDLRSLGHRAFYYPSPRSLWWCLTSSAVVVDSAEWIRGGRLQLLLGASRIQIWHGIPLKEIELALHRRRLMRLSLPKRLVLEAYKWVTARWPRLDLLIATSDPVSRDLLAPAFNAERVAVTGYPRNDVLLQRTSPSASQLLNTDRSAIRRCQQHRETGGTVCLYAPTFRRNRRSAFDDGCLSVDDLEGLGRMLNVLFVVKLHPLIEMELSLDLSHVISYAGDSDVYPLLREVDFLCTDYSSIFFDYLLLDRPVLFFVYDLERYAADDRALNMPFVSIAPGPLCSNQSELFSAITEAVNDPSRYSDARRKLRQYCFDHLDAQSGDRFWIAVEDLMKTGVE